MNRYVIKGRGENRGKYLAYDRKPGANSLAYKWVDDQRKAARWNAQAYPPGNYERRVIAEHNGYFVKMVAPKAIVARVPELQKFIRAHAAEAPERIACYWFGADFNDASLDYCRDCAEKFVDEEFAKDPKSFEELYGECETAEERYNAAIDGGWSTDHDSPPYCDTCGAKLEGSLTDSGADDEIEALTGECKLSFDDSTGWDELDDAVMNIARDDPRWRAIARVVDAAEGLRRANRRPLPDGWRWTGDGCLTPNGRNYIARTFTSGAWVIFTGLDDAADEVAGSREVDEDTARAVVEEHFWQHGWPS